MERNFKEELHDAHINASNRGAEVIQRYGVAFNNPDNTAWIAFGMALAHLGEATYQVRKIQSDMHDSRNKTHRGDTND